jgi:1-deoxy-D-xylulose-5-phosphate synthase
MACEQSKPVVAIYSTFLQRGYDQLIHDVALQNLDVLFAIDRAGLVGEDGPTHHGAYDLSYLRCIPNMVIMTPSDEAECRALLNTGYQHQGPAAVRYPRGSGTGVDAGSTLQPLPLGKGIVRRSSDTARVAVLAFGAPTKAAMTLADELDLTVADMRFVKPMDEALVLAMAEQHDALICIEENARMGGAGSAVLEVLASNGCSVRTELLGIPDHYIDHATPAAQHQESGIDAEALRAAVGRLTA